MAQNFENTVHRVFGLGFHSFAMKDVDHDGLVERGPAARNTRAELYGD